MDEQTVRRYVEAHGQATVAGDLRTAGSDLTKEGAATAGEVMGRLPRNLDSSEVLEVRAEGEAWFARVAYRGEGKEVVVASRWEDRDGRPKIVELYIP